jgi:hypothetical protein
MTKLGRYKCRDLARELFAGRTAAAEKIHCHDSGSRPPSLAEFARRLRDLWAKPEGKTS